MGRHFIARAPGKLILSGEHAVVYGAPAIGFAVDRYVTTEVSLRDEPQFHLELLDFKYHKSMTKKALKHLKNTLTESYEAFKRGERGIKQVLKVPVELSQYVVGHFLDIIQHDKSQGFSLKTQSALPVGCGLGSSAAAILSTMHAIALSEGKVFDKAAYYRWGVDAEHLQHGRSSGLDIYLSLYGGIVYAEAKKFTSLDVRLNAPIQLVNTGTPLASTGECVAAAADFFERDRILLERFQRLTNQCKTALLTADTFLLEKTIRENHQLLIEIAVVPEKVQKFIAALESHGLSAKVCGAGSVQGDRAGVVCVFGKSPIPRDLLKTFAYQAEMIGVDNGGLCAV